MMPPYMSVKVRQTTTLSTTCFTLYEECVGSLTSDRCFITCARACETEPTIYRPGKSNRLQMSLQRQHFLLIYLKTLSAGPAGV